jgi:SAF domain-containing protein
VNAKGAKQDITSRNGADAPAAPGTATATATAARRRAAAAPVTDSPSGRPARRHWGRFALGLSVSLLGGWLFAALYLSAGSRRPVAVVARDIDRFAVIEEGDITTDRVAAGDRVRTIPGDQVDDIVGRVAATDLSEGMVMSPDNLVEDEDSLLGESEARVGASLPPGAAPATLAGGDPVELVLVGGPSDDEDVTDTVRGWVIDAGAPDDRTGDRVVELVVARDQADEVAAAARQDRLAVYAVRGR